MPAKIETLNKSLRDVLLNIFTHYEKNKIFLQQPVFSQDAYMVILSDVSGNLTEIRTLFNNVHTDLLTSLRIHGPVLTKEDVKILTDRFTQVWSNRDFWLQLERDILSSRIHMTLVEDKEINPPERKPASFALTSKPSEDPWSQRPRKTTNWGDALKHLKLGGVVTNQNWNGSGLTIHLQVPDAYSKMTLPYFYLEYPADHRVTPGARVPWIPSVTDNLSESWILL